MARREDFLSAEQELAAAPRGDGHPLQQVIEALPSLAHPTMEAARARYLMIEVIAAALTGVAQAVLVRWTESEDRRSLGELFDENVTIVRRTFEETVADGILR